jgi:hypothetical protein
MYIMREADRKVALRSPGVAGVGICRPPDEGPPASHGGPLKGIPAGVGGRSLQELALTRSWPGGMTSQNSGVSTFRLHGKRKRD